MRETSETNVLNGTLYNTLHEVGYHNWQNPTILDNAAQICQITIVQRTSKFVYSLWIAGVKLCSVKNQQFVLYIDSCNVIGKCAWKLQNENKSLNHSNFCFNFPKKLSGMSSKNLKNRFVDEDGNSDQCINSRRNFYS